MAPTQPADLTDVRPGDVFYWREQDLFSARFRRVTATEVDPDFVRVADERHDPLLFDRASAQVRWPDGLGRSYLEAPTTQVEADYNAFQAEQDLIDAAGATAQGHASVTRGSRDLRCREVARLETAIAIWKRAHAKGAA